MDKLDEKELQKIQEKASRKYREKKSEGSEAISLKPLVWASINQSRYREAPQEQRARVFREIMGRFSDHAAVARSTAA